jgi:glycosyltransferase involved in cell wall biosynthesis
MRIGVSCLQIDPHFTGGVNTYTLGLLEGFARLANSGSFRLYVTEANRQLFDRFQGRKNFEVVVVGNGVLDVRKTACRASLLLGSDAFYKFLSNRVLNDIRERIDSEVDILYVPTVVLPFFNSRRPTVLSMHDIQHVHYPEFFSWPRRLSRRITYGLSARYASYVQASSHFMKQDFLSHFPEMRPDRVEVIPEGVNTEDFAPRSGDADRGLESYQLPERYLFFPAQLWPHKNHLTVLKALKQIEIRNGLRIPLVLTGAKFSAAAEIFAFLADQSMDYVYYLGKVPFRGLVRLYQKAAFLITAVLYESSSLPVLEAAAAGIPIIASRTPSNEELAKVLQLNLFTPLDVDELARVILSLWHEHKSAAAQADHNRRHVEFYDWENAAQKYMGLFKRITSS